MFVTTNQEITASGAVVPPGITHKDKGGKQFLGAGDNWDHLERTVDGKNTTHAMTSIIVSSSASLDPLPRIPRTTACVLTSIPG